MGKPSAPACDRNKNAILEILQNIISKKNTNLIEIGSGTGQHAVFFAPYFPWMNWQTSDRGCEHDGMKQWLEEAREENSVDNIKDPVEFEIGKSEFPQNKEKFDLVFISNILHIISWEKVETLCQAFAENLQQDNQVIIYGPFNYNGEFTAQSNKDFDYWLKQRDKDSGIRNFEDVCQKMNEAGLVLEKDYEMPANNRILHFRKN